MKKTFSIGAVMLTAFTLATSAEAAMLAPVNLGDTTVEKVYTGYSNNPQLENLEYWFQQQGITTTSGANIDPVLNQLQDELFYTQTGGTVSVEFLGIGYASYHSPFGAFTYAGDPFQAFDPNNMYFMDPMFVQNEAPKNSFYSFDLAAGTYFGFYLDANGSRQILTTMINANLDGVDHALFFETNKGYTLAFEDLVGGGDRDYEDLVVNVSGTSAVPEPATILLLISGLAGLGGVNLRRRGHDC